MTIIDSITNENKTIDTKEKNIPEKFEYLKNRVVIVKVDDYNAENIRQALEKIIILLDLYTIFKNKSIFLKPNALAPTKNAFTPPEILVELIKLIKQDTKKILIGDSTMTKTLTDITMKRAKYIEKCEAVGGKVVNFFESKREKITLKNPEYEAEENIYLPKEICDSDIVINIPKLKTHNGFVYTGAIKNLFGLLGNKMLMHMTHDKKREFQKMLADIYFAVEETNKSVFPKVLTIMDAVIAMEGKGPRSGNPRKVGLIIAGFNSAAVDIVGYTLMNGNPNHLEAIKSIARRTNLSMDIAKLEILGESNYSKFIIKDFKKPKTLKTILEEEKQPRKPNKKPGLYSKIRKKAMSISIRINRKACLLCEQCVQHCPAEAMIRRKERIEINYNKCIECFCCGESCPNDAISTKWWIFRKKYTILLILILMASLLLYLVWSFIQYLLNFF